MVFFLGNLARVNVKPTAFDHVAYAVSGYHPAWTVSSLADARLVPGATE